MYRSTSHYGWQPDLPDHRDLKYVPKSETISNLPTSVDLRNSCPPVYDQGHLGSCTANAIGAAFQFDLMKQGAINFLPSRLFIYYNERSIEDTITVDKGAQIRDGIKSIASLGVCPETMWPYVPSEFAHKPYQQCYQDALKHKAVTYQKVAQDLNQIRSCLAEGYPVVIGFSVYNYFESIQMQTKGILKMPQPNEGFVGGHAVLVVGYDDAQKMYMVRNSWGSNWGMNGYFTMPYDYLLHPELARDFWTIRVVNNNPMLQQPGSNAQTSKILPSRSSEKRKTIVGVGGPIPTPVDISVVFKDGNIHKDKLTVVLSDDSDTVIDTKIVDETNPSPIHFDDVQFGYHIYFDGTDETPGNPKSFCLGTAEITITGIITNHPVNSPYGPGRISDSFTAI